MTAIAIVYHSVTGRTRALAEAVARGVASLEAADGVATHVLSVEEASRSHDVLAAADAIVFGCPTYMGSASAAFKTFMDATSAVWALQGWRDKLAAGFTHSAAPSGDKLGTLMQLSVFAAQHGMIWVGLGLPPTYAAVGNDDADEVNRLGSHLGAMAQSRPGGGTLGEGDLRTAERLGKRVAEAALRWSRGDARAHAQKAEKDEDRERERTKAIARRSYHSFPPPPEEEGRHPTTRSWEMPKPGRERLGEGLDRINVKEILARPGRFEHHLLVCASIGGVQLEVTTASEPLYFAHVNLSDEYALALPSGDELVDRFPLRTFLSSPETGEDVGRYNHRIGDLVLHPEGLLHWPGRLRAPYEPFDFPPGMRRCGLSLVYCASKVTPPTWCPLPPPAGREADAKAYVSPAPPMILAAMRGEPGVLARIGPTSLALHALPDVVAPEHGGFCLVLEAERGGPHAACDLIRIAKGAKLRGEGIVRALVFSSEESEPDLPPHLWTALPEPPFAPFEDGSPRALPLEVSVGGGDGPDALVVTEASPSRVLVSIGGLSAEVPRHWLARTLFRVGLHGLRLGYVETYEGFFVDDRDARVKIGLRRGKERRSIAVARAEALEVVERIYRAVAPPGYRERAT